MRARLTFELLNDNELRDMFELAMPGTDFVRAIEHHLARAAEACTDPRWANRVRLSLGLRRR